MVSVPSPSYLPPLAFDTFAFSEPPPLTLTIPRTPPPTADSFAPPTAYSHPSRIRGPRVRPRLRLVNGTAPHSPARGSASDPEDASVDADGPAGMVPRARHGESGCLHDDAHAPRTPLLSKLRPMPSFERLERSAADGAVWPGRRRPCAVRPGTAPDLGLSSSRPGAPSPEDGAAQVAAQGGDGPQPSADGRTKADARRAAVAFEVSHKPRTAPPAMRTPAGDAMLIDVSHENPFKFQVADPDGPPYPPLIPPAAVPYDDHDPTSRPDSLASSRPPSALPGTTLDALEDIAVGLRTMVPDNHPQAQEVVVRGRRPVGPRPRSPPSASSAYFARSALGSAYSSTDVLDVVDEAGPSERDRARSSSPRARALREDVEWVAEYGLWCTSTKGKWKVPWVEADADEINATHAAQPPEPDTEPYFTYDPQNAPEFLVGKSNSLTVTAAPGFHSGRRLPRLRAARRPQGRNHRPPGLRLAPGFQPDPPTPDDGHPLPPPLPAPPHSAPATRSHFDAKHPHKQPDLRGLELLIGPLEPRTKLAPKPKTPVAPPPVTHNRSVPMDSPSSLAPVRREPRIDLFARSTASWEPAASHPPRNSFTRTARPRRNMFASLKRWFRRLTR